MSTSSSGLPPGPHPGNSRPRTRKEQRRDELLNTSLRAAMKPSSPAGAIVVMAVVIAVLWVILGVDAATGHHLFRFGIKPRELGGLWGILLGPVVHANASQLAANSITLAVFGWIMLVSGLRYVAIVTAGVWLVSGVVGWVAAPSGTVILGASGVIFGWLGYVLARAWFGRKIAWIATAVAVLLVFSGMLSGLLPKLGNNTFWGDQLGGFLAGIAIAALLHAKRKDRAPKSAAGL